VFLEKVDGHLVGEAGRRQRGSRQGRDRLHAELDAQGLQQVGLRNGLAGKQDLADAPPLPLLDLEGLLEGGFGKTPFLDEYPAERSYILITPSPSASMWVFFSSETALACPGLSMMWGVRKMKRFVLPRLLDWDLKSHPRRGMSPR
jgi:hypothetical protein